MSVDVHFEIRFEKRIVRNVLYYSLFMCQWGVRSNYLHSVKQDPCSCLYTPFSAKKVTILRLIAPY